MKLLKRISGRISSDVTARKIADNIIGKQHRLADYLNGKTKKLKGSRLLIALIAFSMLFAGYCAYLILNALNN